MRFRKYTCSIIILFFIISCTNNTVSDIDVSDHEDFYDLYIDPTENASLRTKDFVDSIQFIPLETTNESEFSEIVQIEALPERYIILDKNTSEILFFNKQGRFIKKISPQSKELPTPYKNIAYFAIDRIDNKLYFNDLESMNKYEFTLDGNFIGLDKKKEIDYTIREIHYLNGYRLSYFGYRSFLKDQKKSHNVAVFKDDGVIKSYLSFDASKINRDDVYGSRKYFHRSDGSLFFTLPYDANVYGFSDSGEMFRAFHFDFPNRLSIPQDFTTHKKYFKKRKRFIKENGNKIYLITDFYKMDRHLAFRLVGGKYSSEFLYDLTKKTTISLTKYVSDSTTYFLPIIGGKILGVDEGRLLSSFSAKQFVEIINKRGRGSDIPSLPKDIIKIYEQGNDQNPILLLTTFKKEIVYDTTF